MKTCRNLIHMFRETCNPKWFQFPHYTFFLQILTKKIVMWNPHLLCGFEVAAYKEITIILRKCVKLLDKLGNFVNRLWKLIFILYGKFEG